MTPGASPHPIKATTPHHIKHASHLTSPLAQATASKGVAHQVTRLDTCAKWSALATTMITAGHSPKVGAGDCAEDALEGSDAIPLEWLTEAAAVAAAALGGGVEARDNGGESRDERDSTDSDDSDTTSSRADMGVEVRNGRRKVGGGRKRYGEKKISTPGIYSARQPGESFSERGCSARLHPANRAEHFFSSSPILLLLCDNPHDALAAFLALLE